jgi:hypothetical protein
MGSRLGAGMDIHIHASYMHFCFVPYDEYILVASDMQPPRRVFSPINID